MLIKELDLTNIDTLGNLLADLMRTPPFNHVQPRPPVLCLRARGGTNEQGVLQLSLEVVLLDMISESGRHFPEQSNQRQLQ